MIKGTASETTFGLMISHIPHDLYRAYVREKLATRVENEVLADEASDNGEDE